MSKKLTLVISLLLITCIFFGTMAACGGGSKQGGTSTTPTPAETPTTDTKTKPTDTGTSDGETFRLGIIYPLTGDLSKFGQEEIKGVEIAADLVNAQGGINGIPIELVKADAPTPDAATAEVERLINVEKVHAIMGSYSSGVAYAGSAVAEKNQTVWWENSGVADNITQRGFKYLFRFGITGSNLGESQAKIINELVAEKLGTDPKDLKIALIYEDSAYGTSVADGMEAEANKLGLNIVLREGYSSKTTDLSSLILKMKQAGANVVAPTFYVADGLLLFKQMKELNYQPDAMVCGANSVQDLKNVLGDGINGLIHADITVARTNEKAAKGLTAYVEEYKSRYNQELWSAHSIRTYAGAMVFFEALKSAKSFSADDIAEACMAIDIPLYET
ncbi:MAG TPA: ABC transporter substrate-binding protein, partial [Clostridiales bacterium]|nr:ABC transporter substrate-binding protein [Clostridiales bacterium]